MIRYQKGKTNLDFTEARDSEWQWHQLGHIQVCISLQTDNHASTPPLKFFTGQIPLLPPNQQRQSTEGKSLEYVRMIIFCSTHRSALSFIPVIHIELSDFFTARCHESAVLAMVLCLSVKSCVLLKRLNVGSHK